MNFKPELCKQVLAGCKTVTRRPVNGRTTCLYQAGRDYAVCPGRGKRQLGRIVVRSVRTEPVGVITDGEAVLEGFADREEFIAYWRTLYGGWEPSTPVYRIEFHVVHINTELVGVRTDG